MMPSIDLPSRRPGTVPAARHAGPAPLPAPAAVPYPPKRGRYTPRPCSVGDRPLSTPGLLHRRHNGAPTMSHSLH